jgi:hypothetical protein
MVSNLFGNSKCKGGENFCKVVWNLPGGRGGRFSSTEWTVPFSEPIGLGAGGTR